MSHFRRHLKTFHSLKRSAKLGGRPFLREADLIFRRADTKVFGCYMETLTKSVKSSNNFFSRMIKVYV